MTKVSVTILPAHLDWPEAVSDLTCIPTDVRKLRLVTRTSGWDKLNQFSGLEDLWCFDINQTAWRQICKCASLKTLYVENLKIDSLACLGQLPALTVLSIESCSQIDSLVELTNLRKLKGLAITHFKNVHDVTPLADLIDLRELAIAGSMWTRMKIKSLSPLARLVNLEYLNLTNLKVEDESLKPLAGLYRLEQLDIANFYPMEEFAWLSGKLKQTHCTWFRPYVPFPSIQCSKCGSNEMVMLTGKRNPSLCKKCDRRRLEKQVAAFDDIAGKAA